MRDFNKIDLNSLKAFYFACETGNFSKAAILAGLTQSGVSQHISRLEIDLGIKLFRRGKRGVEVTEAGIELQKFAQQYLDQVDNLFVKIDKRMAQLTGVVNYGMPASCLKTPHFSLLLKARTKFAKIELNVTISDNETILDKIINSKLDFGFVTKKVNHTGLIFHKFATEEYVMVGKKDLISKLNSKTFLDAPFVDYPGMGTLLEFWQIQNMPSKRSFNISTINKVGSINDLDGAITMCLYGVGVSVFPLHCVQKLLKVKKLTSYNQSKNPQENIYIVQRSHVDLPARVEKVLETFWGMK